MVKFIRNTYQSHIQQATKCVPYTFPVETNLLVRCQLLSTCRQTVNSNRGRVHIDNKTPMQPGPQTTAIDTQEIANKKIRTEDAVLQRNI